MATEHAIKNFKFGVVNELEAESIPEGSASDSLNWLTKGDMIEIRRDSKILGTLQMGSGKITGFHVAQKSNGVEIAFISRGRKVFYFNTVTEEFGEIGTDILAAAASGEDVAFTDYKNNAGDALYFSSANSSLFKVMLANPGSYADMYDSSKNFKGYIKVKDNRMYLWYLKNDKTGVYLSKIDNLTYTTVSAEAIGLAGSLAYSGTLAFKGGGSKRTCFGVTFTDGVETFTDNYDNTLTGSAGGTGTINYMTGAYSITFNAAAAGAVTSTYQWVDDTVGGICDFTKSGTRLAGEGAIFRQDDGGNLQNILFYGDSAYCMHQNKTWVLTLSADDTDATNLIFRENVGIPNWRAAIDTGDGIYFIDTAISSNPRFRLLTLEPGSGKVVPKDVTNNFDFSGYSFADSYLDEFDDFILIFAKRVDSASNDRSFAYHKIWQSIDPMDYYGRCGGVYNGAFHVGDSVTNNIWNLFSGFDDDDAGITNYWIGNFSQLGLAQLKRSKRLRIRGLIQNSQNIDVYLNLDNTGFTLVGTIDGDGNYVDQGQAVYIGANTVGSREIGGGGDGEYAYRYVFEIGLRLGKFKDVKVKLVADASVIGYASVSEIEFLRILDYPNKLPSSYAS